MLNLHRDSVESDIYDIIEWLTTDFELPSFEEVAHTQTGMGMMQGARIAAYRAAVELRELKLTQK